MPFSISAEDPGGAEPVPGTPVTFIQFKNGATPLGLADADTLIFGDGLTATRGTGEHANEVTVTSEGSGGGSGGAPLVVSLEGSVNAAFDAVDFSTWSGTIYATSADATWDEANNRVNIVTPGMYEVRVQSNIEANAGTWPIGSGDWCLYGSTVQEAIALRRSQYYRHAEGNFNDANNAFMQFDDTYTVYAPDAMTVQPKLYANKYNGSGDAAIMRAIVTVKRIGDYGGGG